MTRGLDAAQIRAELAARGCPLEVVAHAETGSTNDDAKALARAGAPPTLVVADAQRAGRGRSGNAWWSPPGANLYLSVLGRAALDGSRLAPLTLAVGCALLGPVDRRLPGRAALKWPNDLWVDGRKLAGVLVEATFRADQVGAVIVGVGLNVATRAFPPPLDAVATSLAAEGSDALDRDALAVELALAITGAIATYAAGGLAPFAATFAARDALRGRAIRVGDVAGRAEGIDAEGRLCVHTGDGRVVPVGAGHVELLP